MRHEHPIHPQQITLHWLMAALLLVAIAAILGRAQLPSGHEWRPLMRNIHLVTGQLILGLVLVRLLVRWKRALPPAVGVSTWATWAGRVVHGLLYGVMLAQPITGILFMQAGGKPVGMFGWHLPLLIPEDKELHAQLKEAHQIIGTLFYGLVAIHVCAALWHHVVLRNRTLHRMLPGLPARIAASDMVSASAASAAWARTVAQAPHILGTDIDTPSVSPLPARLPNDRKQSAVIDQ